MWVLCKVFLYRFRYTYLSKFLVPYIFPWQNKVIFKVLIWERMNDSVTNFYLPPFLMSSVVDFRSFVWWIKPLGLNMNHKKYSIFESFRHWVISFKYESIPIHISQHRCSQNFSMLICHFFELKLTMSSKNCPSTIRQILNCCWFFLLDFGENNELRTYDMITKVLFRLFHVK